MKTKTAIIEGRRFDLIRYKNEWVFPFITIYEFGLGSPIAFMLYYLEGESLEYYTSVTVNIPGCGRSAGCQFIDTNNNDSDILDWLEENHFGKRTGGTGTSGFCTYPEFDFYKGEKFHEYKRNSHNLQS
jgi:hypothetical protein